MTERFTALADDFILHPVVHGITHDANADEVTIHRTGAQAETLTLGQAQALLDLLIKFDAGGLTSGLQTQLSNILKHSAPSTTAQEHLA